MTPSLHPLLTLLLVAALGSLASAQLCPPAADPCVVTSSVTVTAPSIDLGDRALVINAGRTVTVRAIQFELRAGSVLLQPGARILAPGAGGFGPIVTITTARDIILQRAGTSVSRIDLSADSTGGILYLVAGEDVRSDGLIDARALDGGEITVTASGEVALGGSGVTAPGGAGGSGGEIMVSAASGIGVDGLLDVGAGDLGAGRIELDTQGDLRVGPAATLDVRATGLGTAGTLRLHAAGMVELGGVVDGRAATGLDGGQGADLAMQADGGDVVITGAIDVSGASGGAARITAAGDVLQGAPLDAAGKHVEGFGGTVVLHAGGNLAMAAIDAHGGDSGGELVEGRGMAIAVDGNVLVDGIGGPGGTIDLHGCQVDVPAGVTLSATGSGGINLLKANGAMTIAGSLVAGEANRLEYATVPPLVLSSPTPPATIVQTALPPCGLTTPSTSTTTTSTTATSTTTTPTTTSSTTSTSGSTTSSTSASSTTSTTSSTSTSTSSTGTPSSTATTSSTTSSSATSSTATTTSGSTSSSTSTTIVSPIPGTSTSTTLPAAGCPEAAGFAAVRCELAAADAALDDLPPGSIRDRLGAKLARAVASHAESEARCGTGGTAAAREAIRSTRRRLKGLTRRVRALLSRGLIDAGGAAGLLEPADRARARLRELRARLACPPPP